MGGSGRFSLWMVIVAFVVTTGVLSPAADAQTPTRDEPFPQLLKGTRWGPFLVERRFSIDNIGYDDNVFLTVDNDAAESDFIIGLGPEIRAQVLFGPNMALTVRDRLSGEVFLRNSQLNHADNTFDGQYDLLLGPVLLTSSGRWSTARQRPNSEIDDRTRIRTRDLGQTFRLFLSPRIDVSARFEERRRRFSDADRLVAIDPDGDGTVSRVPIGEALDRTEETLRGEVGWRLAGGTRVFVSWSDKDIDFESDAAGRDATDDRTTLGLDLSPSASLRGRVEIGRAELRSTDLAFDYTPFEGTVGEAEVSYLPTGSTRITLSRGRDVRFSTFDQNLFFEEELTGLSAESYLGSRWGLQAGWERRKLDYPEENSFASPRGERRKDEITNTYAGVVFRLIGNAELGIRFGVRERESNASSFIDKQRYVTTTGSYDF